MSNEISELKDNNLTVGVPEKKEKKKSGLLHGLKKVGTYATYATLGFGVASSLAACGDNASAIEGTSEAGATEETDTKAAETATTAPEIVVVKTGMEKAVEMIPVEGTYAFTAEEVSNNENLSNAIINRTEELINALCKPELYELFTSDFTSSGSQDINEYLDQWANGYLQEFGHSWGVSVLGDDFLMNSDTSDDYYEYLGLALNNAHGYFKDMAEGNEPILYNAEILSHAENIINCHETSRGPNRAIIDATLKFNYQFDYANNHIESITTN